MGTRFNKYLWTVFAAVMVIFLAGGSSAFAQKGGKGNGGGRGNGGGKGGGGWQQQSRGNGNGGWKQQGGGQERQQQRQWQQAQRQQQQQVQQQRQAQQQQWNQQRQAQRQQREWQQQAQRQQRQVQQQAQRQQQWQRQAERQQQRQWQQQAQQQRRAQQTQWNQQRQAQRQQQIQRQVERNQQRQWQQQAREQRRAQQAQWNQQRQAERQRQRQWDRQARDQRRAQESEWNRQRGWQRQAERGRDRDYRSNDVQRIWRGRDDDRGSDSRGRASNWPWSGPGNSDWGHSRQAYQHARRDARQYQRELEKQYRWEDKISRRSSRDYWRDRSGDWVNYPTYSSGYSNNYSYYPQAYPVYRTYSYVVPSQDYYYDYYDQYPQYSYAPQYYDRASWMDQVLGIVVSSFLGDRFGDVFTGPQYDGYYLPEDYAYTDGSNYYSVYPQYGSYYSPDLYVYDPASNYYPVRQFSVYDGFSNLLPFADMFSPYSNGYIDNSAREAYGYGYEQGYADGLNAARYSQDASFYDPYIYPDRGYDMYSTSIAANRQMLSAAYEQGYQDALEGRDIYGSEDALGGLAGLGLGDGGDFDLVSLLLNGVLSMVNI